jgi:hypothetical protein
LNEDVILALIKSAIISYARPFTGNKASLKKQSWNLDLKFVPKEHLKTHYQAIEYRDKFIAHTDIEFRKPELLKSTHHFAIGHNSIISHEYNEFSKCLSDLSRDAFRELSSFLRQREI